MTRLLIKANMFFTRSTRCFFAATRGHFASLYLYLIIKYEMFLSFVRTDLTVLPLQLRIIYMVYHRRRQTEWFGAPVHHTNQPLRRTILFPWSASPPPNPAPSGRLATLSPALESRSTAERERTASSGTPPTIFSHQPWQRSAEEAHPGPGDPPSSNQTRRFRPAAQSCACALEQHADEQNQFYLQGAPAV